MADKMYKLYQEQKKEPLTDEFIEKAFDIMMEDESELIPYIQDFRIRDF